MKNVTSHIKHRDYVDQQLNIQKLEILSSSVIVAIKNL